MTDSKPRTLEDMATTKCALSSLPVDFGVEALRLIGESTAEVVTGLRRQRQIEHVHQLGARAVGELLYEVSEGGDLDRALDAYERLTPDLLQALGGDCFPPLPIHEVQR